ncbi:MAG: Glyoxalase/bleomycin resistance protein/dioxygenase [Phycisphaerales bacterium]|jgi:catechol 2,3-dioxygenase-like lactoylglutathione lyase family enzyme|nr:Glyoxalase/bleomycin resistance protein/dioxygenase [Phycisphaerales bacterium]
MTHFPLELMKQAMIISLDHVQLAMPVGQEPGARAFYGELLGLEEIEKPPVLRARGGAWFRLNDGRQVHLGVEEPFRPSLKAHPCFIVDGIMELADRLRRGNVEPLFDELAAPIVRFYVSDRFGNRLEFADRGGPCVAKSI